MKPNFRNLFMKKLTRDRVVPIISASVSWLTFAITGSGLTFLAKIRQQKKRPCQALLARIEQLIDQSASTRMVRAKRCEMNISENAGSSWRTRIMAAFSSRMISHSVIAAAVAMRRGCPVRHPSPQNSSGPQDCDDGFLALLGNNGEL